jgi:hypothetical protein
VSRIAQPLNPPARLTTIPPSRTINPTSISPHMNEEEKIKLLCDQAKDWYGTLTDFIFKHTSIQLVVLGWAISSSDARRYVKHLKDVALFAYPIPGLLVLGNSVLALVIYRRVWRKSDYVMSQLANLSREVAQLYKPYQLSPSFWVSMWCVHFALSVVTIYCLYCT